MLVLIFILFLYSVKGEESACKNTVFDLSHLTSDVDYETPPFNYGGFEWTIVYNFCQNTVRTCSNKRYPAFMHSPNRDSKCMAILPTDDWDEAEWYVNDESNGIICKLY